MYKLLMELNRKEILGEEISDAEKEKAEEPGTDAGGLRMHDAAAAHHRQAEDGLSLGGPGVRYSQHLRFPQPNQKGDAPEKAAGGHLG